MPTTTWSAKRERQYAHIKTSLLESGKPEPLAEEIAARVVNKERAQHGESVEASASSLNDMSASRRGGLRSHKGPGGRTLLQLRNEARQRGLKGRSKMNKAELEAALTR
nr:plasmid stabilization protein [uncultured Albidiferax sp.]